MLNKNRIGAMCALVFFIGFCGISEAKELKIGYVNVAKVFDEYNKTKESDKVLEKKGQDKQLSREKYVSELKKMKDELELLSDKAKADRQKEIDSKMDALQKFDRETREDLRRERDMMAREILKDIDGAISEIGGQDDYTVVLDERMLLYSVEEMDVTGKVVNLLNNRYKKAGDTGDKKR